MIHNNIGKELCRTRKVRQEVFSAKLFSNCISYPSYQIEVVFLRNLSYLSYRD